MEATEELKVLEEEKEKLEVAKEEKTKEKQILEAKLKEVREKYKQEIQKIKNQVREEIREAEKYMAFLLLRFIENENAQEEIAYKLYNYILNLDAKNKKEIERAKKHVEILKHSNKKIYVTLAKLLNTDNKSTL